MSEQFFEYSQRLTRCMMTYQFIEFGLRFCLHRCHAVVKFRLDGHLAYEYPLETIENAALDRLIESYKIFTTNQGLIKDLRKIKGDRNRIAHQGYLFTIEEQHDDAFLRGQSQDLEVAHQRAEACFHELRREMERTDEIVTRVYAELREKRLSQGQALPESPAIKGAQPDNTV